MHAAAWGGSAVPRLAGVDELEPRSRPDVSPMVALCLVTLIIFMVITPALAIEYKPPKAGSAVIRPDQLPTLGIDYNGRYYVGDRGVRDADLVPALTEEMKRLGGDVLLLKSDGDADYLRVEAALRGVQRAGVRRVLIDAELPRQR